jgi:hypothetical protein
MSKSSPHPGAGILQHDVGTAFCFNCKKKHLNVKKSRLARVGTSKLAKYTERRNYYYLQDKTKFDVSSKGPSSSKISKENPLLERWNLV